MKIEREMMAALRLWKSDEGRKPILLQGARQIGKTWLMETFGRECFDYVAKFDFDRQPELAALFGRTKEPARLLKELALYTDVPIEPGRTLIVFDEIQQCEAALNSLKYFCEDAPGYHIIAAGSLLGVAVRRRGMTVPVGKVRVLRMFPVSFREFLLAADPQIHTYINSMEAAGPLPETALSRLNAEYRRYMVCGGMPEAASAMLAGRGVGDIDDILRDILDLYELDFAKYAEPRDIPRIHAIWHSLPAQLAKENRKFLYKVARPGARAKDYEDALLWLEDAGMIHRVFCVSNPALPLSAYEDCSAFKVYAGDCGLLRRLAGLPATAVVEGAAGYTEFKGAMAENAVLLSLLAAGAAMPHYWAAAGRAEVEFVVQSGGEIVPVEVKAENCIAGRSLSVYRQRYEPRHSIRFSALNMRQDDGLLCCPAPMAAWAGNFMTGMP